MAVPRWVHRKVPYVEHWPPKPKFSVRVVCPAQLDRADQTKALSPVMDLPTINVFISRVPS
ncbi:MAG: hypothetical protein QOG10_4486 [Kribbellaceae bacterium]|jgi:hypothetical protein|nr:hypothetical protein [Kribbellaceae bacterium]